MEYLIFTKEGKMDKISLCMIVKNEADNLKDCLGRAAGYVDEIIVVDTGSTDNTRKIALNYADKVYDFLWKDDFSAARNYAISKAGNPYILVLDADEWLQDIDRDEIEKQIQVYPEGIGRILIISQYTRENHVYKQKERVGRLFSKEFYQYEGRIHEQLVPLHGMTAMQSNSNYYDVPVVVEHLGYEGNLDVRRRKTQRNITLLKRVQEQNPEDPYLLYQLGKSFYMEEEYEKACEYFGQALYFDLDPRLEYVQDMVESYGYALINTEQYETALQMINIYDEFSHSADFLFLIGLILMNNGRFEEAIKEFKKAAMKPDSKVEGVNGYLAFYNIGVIYECLGSLDNAVNYYKKCGEYRPALRKLQDMI